MKTLAKASISICIMMAGTTGQALSSDGVDINHLGVNNTLVRVNGDGKYLMMPVQESIDDATVNVLVDGQLDRTIYVRLAKSKVDYTVPFDLTPYKGHELILNVVTSQNRSTVREAKDDACWNNFTLTDSINIENREKYRPAYHHTPLYGWMNDPNGMFYKDGLWHLYYQQNPYGSKWQNMTWGHASSPDLIHWTHHPAAIEPDGLGSIFSGSCAIDSTDTTGHGTGTVMAMYTSAGASQVQSLAWSTDGGMTFKKYAANPVITLDSEARDPNFFWNSTTNEWNLVLAHALEHEMLIFSSPDMKKWTLQSSFGKGLGAQEGVWECPDLFQLPVDGTDQTKWVLLCNLNPGGPFGGSGIQYFTGDFDGHEFTPDKDANGYVATKWLDFGKDNYAMVSWSDAPQNRRTLIGWMSNWQYAAEIPTMQFRSANTLPREIGLFKGNDGQVYASTVPSPEVDALRGKTLKNRKSIKVKSRPVSFSLPAENDGICEIDMTLNARDAGKMVIELKNDADERVIMTYDSQNHTFSMDRRYSGITDFSQDFPVITTAPTFESDGKLGIRLFIDRSSIEAFENNGHFAMTNLVFPTKPYTTMTVTSEGAPARLENLTIYPLNI